MCVYSTSEISEIIKPIADEYGVKQVYLFGSYARGEATEESDVDLYMPHLPQDMGIRYFGMYDMLTEALLKKIDIVSCYTDFISEDIQKRFEKNLKKDMVKIYG